MPIYEYRCDGCGFQKEFIQRMSDPRLTDCPECKQPTLNKMVTAAGFQLKGSGWYVTDFRDSGNKNAGAAKKTEEKQSDTSGKDGGKSESATAATPAAKSESSAGSGSESSSSSAASSPSSASGTPAASSASSSA